MKKIPNFIKVLFVFVAAFIVSHVPDVSSFFKEHNANEALAASPLVTVFTRQIKENLYPANEFYKNSIDHSMFVNGNKVNVPQSGSDPTLIVDPVSFPLPVESSEETALEYEIHTHATKPTHITDDEELVVSYEKRAHVLRKHINTINTSVADWMLYDWSGVDSTSMVRTSGADGSSLAPGATGTRKKITYANLLAVSTLMDTQDIPADGRFGVIPAHMYNELLDIDRFIDYDKRGKADLIAQGFIGEIFGIKLYKRSRAGIWTNAGTPVLKAPGAATATSDNMAALFWHKDSVARAEGGVKVYLNPDKAEYLGGLFNARVRAGGHIDREDKKGVVALIQAA